jgi:hypothetical protein
MVARGIGREDFAMTRIGETKPYRGIEFGIYDNGDGTWQWAYYPKIGQGTRERGQVKRDRETAIAAAKAAIDKWLGPSN